MDSTLTLSYWVLGLIGLGFLLLGIVLGSKIAKRSDGADSAKTVELQTELDEYRQRVAEHFNETGQMLTNLSDQYRKVYEHLGLGAIELAGSTAELPAAEQDDLAAPQVEIEASSTIENQDNMDSTAAPTAAKAV